MVPARDIRLYILRNVLLISAVSLAILHIIAVIAAVHFPTSYIAEISPKIDLDNELNIPTAYSGILLGCCGLMCLLLVQVNSRFSERLRWIVISLFFFLLAFDELLSVHEAIAEPIRKSLSILDGSVFYHAWVIPALAVITTFALATYFIKSRSQMSLLQKRIMLYIVILGIGNVALEAIGTQVYFSTLVYKLGPVMLEEMFEISMISSILYQLTAGLLKSDQDKS